MTPTKQAAAVKAAAKAVSDSAAGISTRDMAAHIGCSVRATKAVVTIACAKGLISYARALGSYVWMTPKRAEECRKLADIAAKSRKKARAKILSKERTRNSRSRANGMPPLPRKTRTFEFGITDDELKNGRRSVVSANDALKIMHRPMRWVFDLGRAA